MLETPSFGHLQHLVRNSQTDSMDHAWFLRLYLDNGPPSPLSAADSPTSRRYKSWAERQLRGMAGLEHDPVMLEPSTAEVLPEAVLVEDSASEMSDVCSDAEASSEHALALSSASSDGISTFGDVDLDEDDNADDVDALQLAAPQKVEQLPEEDVLDRELAAWQKQCAEQAANNQVHSLPFKFLQQCLFLGGFRV